LKSTAGALVAALAAGGCAPNVLVAVGSCPDGGALTATGCTFLLADLVGWWRLDEAPGSAVARDLSGSGNDGALTGLDPATAWAAGRSAGGLAVGGAGFVDVSASTSIDSITDQVTISGWGFLDRTITDEYATIASREDAATIDQHYHIGLYRNLVPTTFITTEDGIAILRGPAATMGTWVHLATTYDGGFVRFYVDGKEVMSQTLTGHFKPDTTPVILGGNDNAGAGVTERFAGRVDEIMLYRRALSATEIARLNEGLLFMPPRPDRDGGRD
jgi:hypothetical protein